MSAYGTTLATVGRLDEALVQLKRAVELEVVLGLASVRLGLVYYFKREYASALQLFERAIEREPGFQAILGWFIADSHHATGRTSEAVELAVGVFPPGDELALRRGYEDGGWPGLQRAALDRRLAESELRCPPPRGAVMGLSAILGEGERMFACLEHFDAPPYTWAWMFDPYRDDPRFDALLRKWNLEDAPFASE